MPARGVGQKTQRRFQQRDVLAIALSDPEIPTRALGFYFPFGLELAYAYLVRFFCTAHDNPDCSFRCEINKASQFQFFHPLRHAPPSSSEWARCGRER